jgi:hypothetical protein
MPFVPPGQLVQVDPERNNLDKWTSWGFRGEKRVFRPSCPLVQVVCVRRVGQHAESPVIAGVDQRISIWRFAGPASQIPHRSDKAGCEGRLRSGSSPKLLSALPPQAATLAQHLAAHPNPTRQAMCPRSGTARDIRVPASPRHQNHNR